MRSVSRLLFLAIPALAFLGCGGGGGGSKVQVSVAVQPGSVSATAGATVPFTAQVTGSGDSSVTWSVTPAGGGSIDANGLYHAPATPGDYKVVATSHADASATASASVKVVAMPALATFSADHSTITAGGSASITATFSDGTAVLNPGAVALTSGTAVSVSPAATTTYTITVSNAAGSSVADELTVSVVPAPSVSAFAPARATITAGDTTTLAATYAGGIGSVDQGLGQVASGAAVSVRPAATTTYHLSVANAAGATATAQTTVSVVAAPVASSLVASASTLTSGHSLSLTPSFSGGSGVINPGAIPATSGTAVNLSPSATTTYTLSVTNAAGTVATQQATVTVVPAPSIISFVAGRSIITAGDTVGLRPTYANGTGSVDQGLGQVASNTAVSVRPAATTTYTLTVSDAAGDSATAQTTVTVVPAPTATSLTNSQSTITAGGSALLTPVFANGTASMDNGVGALSSGTPVSVSPAATTLYTMTVTNAAGATAIKRLTITVVPAPTVSSFLAAAPAITAGGFTSLTPVFSGAVNAVIDHGVGTVVSGQPVQVSPAGTTTYTLTIANAAGTKATSTATVTVDAAPVATSLVATQSPLTAGASTTLTATFSHGTGLINPGALVVTSGVPVSVSPAATTAYTLTVTNLAGATATTQATITVVPAPSVGAFSAAQPTLSAGGTTTLTATFAGGTGLINPGAIPVNSGSPVTVSPAATTAYTLTVTNPAGSTATGSATVTVIPAPKVGSFTTALGTIFKGQAGTAITPVFSNGTGSIDQGIGAVVSGTAIPVNPLATTTYTLTVSNAAGSTDTASVTVNVDATAFSIASFDATPAQVDFGQSTTLGWTYDGNPSSLSLDGASVLGAPASQVVSPVRRQAYRLTGSNPLGGDSRVLKVAARGLDLLTGNVDGPGYADGTGSAARFNNVSGMAVDSHGNLYVADHDNAVIRRITPAGVVSTFAGQPNVAGEVDGNGANARFYAPFAIAIDKLDNLYVADRYANTIRKVTPTADVTTFAGTYGSGSFADGTGPAARFNSPEGVAVDSVGNVYVVDNNNTAIRFITPAGVVSTIAGTAGTPGSTNGAGSVALFRDPLAIACDTHDNVFVADNGNHLIRMLVPNGARTAWTVSTLAGNDGVYGDLDGTGTAATFSQMWGIVADAAGNVWVPGYYSSSVRRITPAGVVTTPLGASGFSGLSNGPGYAARFRDLVGIAFDPASGSLYLGEWDTDDIRKVDASLNVTLFAGMPLQTAVQDGTWASARFNGPGGMAFDASGNLYVADRSYAVRVVGADGTVTSLAGTLGSYGNVNGVGKDARFGSLWGLARGADGSVYVSDNYYHTIRKVAADGTVSTLAGSGSSGFNNAKGTLAQFATPNQLAVDASNNIYVADEYNQVIRKIAPDGTVTTFAGIQGSSGYMDGAGSGPSAVAQFSYPQGLAMDAHGNLIVGDTGNNAIRMIAPDGTVSTLVGPPAGWQSGFVDGDAHTTRFNAPMGVAVDAAGNVFVADYNNHALRKVAPDGSTTTVTGQPGTSGAKTGAFPAAPLYHPYTVCVTPDGDVLVSTVNGIMQATAP